MDREQEEIQFLGFFGILKESITIVSSWRKIFTQITLALILPLSFIYLAHIQISELLFSKIMLNEFILDRTAEGTRTHDRISGALSSEWTAFFLFKIGYFVFFIVLSLLSTSAVVYTIACIYTAKEIAFKKVMSVVPKVWKRLVVTFIWNFVIVFAYNVASLIALFLGAVLFGSVPVIGTLFLILFGVCYFVGFFYITIVWHLATVVSVLEESYGLNAMAKSQALIKGKMWVSFAVFFVVGVFFFGIQLIFEFLVVVGGDGEGVGARVGFGIFCLVLMSIWMLFGLITQTIIYFVCKSYHHENIDKSSLADHLGGYLGEYVPLKSKDVQLEQFEV
ncbi:hypothetical protein ABFS82_08G090700 [Erythranthe guttata]|uniref:Uncharacterized protein n=1 Tax=Erythranthe guttata TaxID=4155 RepID=A0A022Q908_ERYGU|nr:PREDICTED: uncharacterized protein LOC105973251 [Erythranthe guttata]EYU23743.1 hypothetical protein MIMGU_mgv1a026174mg [Erythranthe guttata]|eukprot:XP_012853726.1 PREDICTED: uncharacterized protein LOC105973251 [Erythranthe guttata]